MIEVRNLSFSYGDHPVLRNVSFQLEESGLTALLGRNGAGKTTMFRCILGLEKNYQGSILLNGKEIRKLLPTELAANIAHIPQIHYPSFNYTVQDMVLMGTTHQLKVYSSPGKKQLDCAQAAMEKLGIAHLAQRGYTYLSGGEKQMVLIARALAQEAHVIMMDEPCSALDFGNQSRVMRTIQSLASENYAVLMSTHNPQHALTFCNRVLAISDGTILADGDPGKVMDEELMNRLYSISVNFVQTPHGKVIVPV